jgi:hypothetical protein
MTTQTDTMNPSGVDRRAVEDAIERLIAILDAMDGDPDVEDGADAEPPFGWTRDGDHGSNSQDEEEPSLGWTAGFSHQGSGWHGGTDDREDEHDGREPDYYSDTGEDIPGSAARPGTGEDSFIGRAA